MVREGFTDGEWSRNGSAHVVRLVEGDQKWKAARVFFFFSARMDLRYVINDVDDNIVTMTSYLEPKRLIEKRRTSIWKRRPLKGSLHF